MRAMSAKRRKSTARMKVTRHLVDEQSGGVCGWCGGALAVADDGSHIGDAHHIAQRSAGGADEPSNQVLLHHSCHMFAHEHIDLARQKGIIRDSWEAPGA